MKAGLHFGDNLEWLKRLPDNSVDLCYIDPPFNSKTDYNIMVGGAQTEAFGDTWSWGPDDMKVYSGIVKADGALGKWAEGMMITIGTCGMLSYLIFMAERLAEIKRVLKPTGSIYLHCDKAADYHLRLLLDSVFGPENFRNEIVWLRDPPGKGAKRISKQWPRNSDNIIFYSKSNEFIFYQQYTELNKEQKKAYRYEDEKGLFKAVQRGDYSDKSMEEFRAIGKIYTSSSGKEYIKYYLDEAKATIGNIWTDILGFGTTTASKERVDYPTQKPLALINRIIKASSNEGDLVMDCFLGSGTTAVSAIQNGRNFIGCDVTFLAVDIASDRLKDMENPPEITMTGHPKTIDDARTLAEKE